MTSDFVARSDEALLAQSEQFNTGIASLLEAVGISEAQATQYAARHTAFATIYATYRINNSTTNRILKDEARDDLVASLRELAGVVQKHPGTTDAQRNDLGLTVPSERQRINPPAFPPIIDILSVNGHTVRVRLHEADSTRRGRPAGVAGAAVFSYVGETPPIKDGWKSEGNVARMTFDIAFDSELAPGTKVWITAHYFNRRCESGPAGSPASALINYGAAAAAS